MKKILVALFAAFVATILHAEMRELSFMTAMQVDKAPVLDGELNDEAWKKGVANKNYYKYLDPKGTHFTNYQTRCTIVYNDKGIFAGVVNYQKDISILRRKVLKNNDASIWTDDCAELYFDPAANGVGYFKFVVNANGKNDSAWRMDSANFHEDWRAPGVASAAKVFDDRWEFELFVPWEAYGLKSKPDAGTFWTFNHSRFTWSKGWGPFCSSAPCASGVSPDRFGLLYFSEGVAPTPEKILAMLEERLQSDWGIDLGGSTYLHTLEGTRKIDQTLPELIAKMEAEAKAFDASCKSNLVKIMTGDEPIKALDLKLAGTYDLEESEEYDGYSGWYRQNADMKVAAPHLDWADGLTDKPRVLFITSLGGSMRDMVEFTSRFGFEADVMAGRFNLAGIWEDCVKGGTHLDKCRQIETLLAKNPDVIVCTSGDIWLGIPAKYRMEIARRVRDEGVGLVLSGWQVRNLFGKEYKNVAKDNAMRDSLAAAVPFAEIAGFGSYAQSRDLTKSQALMNCYKIGKGRIIVDESLSRNWNIADPDWINIWASSFETRYAHLFAVLRAAQNREAKVEFFFDAKGVDRVEAGPGSVFTPIGVKVSGSGVFRPAKLRMRLRDSWNNVVRDETRDLGEGENCIAWPFADLHGGNFTLDLIASVGGKTEAVATRAITVVPRVLDFEIARGRTNLVDRVIKSRTGVAASWKRTLDEPLKVRMTLKTLPHGDLVWTREDTVAPRRGSSQTVVLGDKPFPALAGTLTAELFTTNGIKLADSVRTYFFPNHDFDKYTLIMWDNLACGGSLMIPLLAPSAIDEFGYRNYLGESRFNSALFNTRSVPYISHVSLRVADNGGVSWGTYNHTLGWSKEVNAERDIFEGKKAKETNPYDPRLKKILDKYFDAKVKAAAPYGVCVWNLGDECNFSYDAGVGPQDKVPFAEFLKKKYGTIAKFNAVHKTNVADFASAPHVNAAQAIKLKNWPMYYDHVQYMDKMYSDFYQTLSKIIKRHDPKARVGAEGSNAGELEQTVEKLEFWGPYRSMISDELLRCIDPNKVRGIWWGGYFDNLRDGFPVKQWEFVLTGTLNADQWFAMSPGSSQGAYGGDMKFAPYVSKMLPYLKVIRRGMAQSFLETPFRDDGLAFWYSYASTHASKLDERFTPPADSLGALIRFCYRKGYGVKMVTERLAKNLAGTKVLFLSGASSLSDKEVAIIRAWMKKGGKLVADSEPGILDGFLVDRKTPPFKGEWTKFKWSDYSDDEKLEKLLAENGIVNKESISGIRPAEVVFRVREKDDMRLVGFKCIKKSLGSDVTIDLGKEGYVYEFDSGKCLGKMSKIEIPALSVPFKCYSVFTTEQKAPDPENLIPGRVYRVMAFDAEGNEIVRRTKIITAVKGVNPMKEFFIPLNEPEGITYRVRDVNTGLESVAAPVSSGEVKK